MFCLNTVLYRVELIVVLQTFLKASTFGEAETAKYDCDAVYVLTDKFDY